MIDSATETFEFIEYPDSERSSRRPLGTLDPPFVSGGPRPPRLCNLAAFKVLPPGVDLPLPPTVLVLYGDKSLLLPSSAIRVRPKQ